jgi:hypothetical protein
MPAALAEFDESRGPDDRGIDIQDHPYVIEALAAYGGVVHLSADRPDRLDAARGPMGSARLRRTARAQTRAGARPGGNHQAATPEADPLRTHPLRISTINACNQNPRNSLKKVRIIGGLSASN